MSHEIPEDTPEPIESDPRQEADSAEEARDEDRADQQDDDLEQDDKLDQDPAGRAESGDAVESDETSDAGSMSTDVDTRNGEEDRADQQDDDREQEPSEMAEPADASLSPSADTQQPDTVQETKPNTDTRGGEPDWASGRTVPDQYYDEPAPTVPAEPRDTSLSPSADTQRPDTVQETQPNTDTRGGEPDWASGRTVPDQYYDEPAPTVPAEPRDTSLSPTADTQQPDTAQETQPNTDTRGSEPDWASDRTLRPEVGLPAGPGGDGRIVDRQDDGRDEVEPRPDDAQDNADDGRQERADQPREQGDPREDERPPAPSEDDVRDLERQDDGTDGLDRPSFQPSDREDDGAYREPPDQPGTDYPKPSPQGEARPIQDQSNGQRRHSEQETLGSDVAEKQAAVTPPDMGYASPPEAQTVPGRDSQSQQSEVSSDDRDFSNSRTLPEQHYEHPAERALVGPRSDSLTPSPEHQQTLDEFADRKADRAETSESRVDAPVAQESAAQPDVADTQESAAQPEVGDAARPQEQSVPVEDSAPEDSASEDSAPEQRGEVSSDDRDFSNSRTLPEQHYEHPAERALVGPRSDSLTPSPEHQQTLDEFADRKADRAETSESRVDAPVAQESAAQPDVADTQESAAQPEVGDAARPQEQSVPVEDSAPEDSAPEDSASEDSAPEQRGEASSDDRDFSNSRTLPEQHYEHPAERALVGPRSDSLTPSPEHQQTLDEFADRKADRAETSESRVDAPVAQESAAQPDVADTQESAAQPEVGDAARPPTDGPQGEVDRADEVAGNPDENAVQHSGMEDEISAARPPQTGAPVKESHAGGRVGRLVDAAKERYSEAQNDERGQIQLPGMDHLRSFGSKAARILAVPVAVATTSLTDNLHFSPPTSPEAQSTLAASVPGSDSVPSEVPHHADISQPFDQAAAQSDETADDANEAIDNIKQGLEHVMEEIADPIVRRNQGEDEPDA